jgi:uncharacterized membrane protein YfcA
VLDQLRGDATKETPSAAQFGRRFFYGWLGLCYGAWFTVVAVGNYWSTVAAHWPIGVAMLFGSYAAGSTPMGGGTVGFPVLVLFFDMPADMGRDFALAIQSIGMVSASVYILTNRTPVDWRLLRPAMLGAVCSTPLAAALLAPQVADLSVKLIFAGVWASFGMMHFVKLRALVGHHGHADSWHQWDHGIGLAVGVLGGAVAALTGVGIDMVLYATMMLLYRADIKIAIPSSVLLMAFTSVVGIAANLTLSTAFPTHYQIDPQVFPNWLAAAPVVALGAPFGALAVKIIPRGPTLLIVSALCLVQFVWTVVHEQVAGWSLIATCGGVLMLNLVFHLLYRCGQRETQPRAGS